MVFLSFGCATSPKNIDTQYVPSAMYEHLSCEQLRMEMHRMGARVAEVTGKQQREATKDAWAMGIGMIVFWPALFFYEIRAYARRPF